MALALPEEPPSQGSCLRLGSSATSRYNLPVNDWVFQCNPKRYDVDAAVAESLDQWWNTPRQRSQITVGDRVWLAIVGPHDPGIHYMATVSSPTYTVPQDEFGEWKTDIHFDFRVAPFLSRAELLDDPVLDSVSALRGFQGSNRLIPADAGRRLMDLARARLYPLERNAVRTVREPDLDLGRAIDRHTSDVRMRLKEEIYKLTSLEFELLVVRILGELDFEVAHVGHSGDGGVDAEAILSLRGLTTSDFSTDARQEALAAGKARIGLLGGDDLVTLCLEGGIGVTTKQVVLYELNAPGLKADSF